LLPHQRRRIWQSPLEAPNFSAKWRKKTQSLQPSKVLPPPSPPLPTIISLSLSLSNPPTETPEIEEMYTSHWDFLLPSQQPHHRTRIANQNFQTDRRKNEAATDAKLSSSALYPECGNPRGILLSV
jgi:hypothetical protein